MACPTVEACDDCPLVVGDSVNIRYHLTDKDGEPADGTVSLAVKQPDGTVANPSFTHDGLGEYHCDFASTMAGQFFYTASSTGGVVDATNGAFLVAAAAA